MEDEPAGVAWLAIGLLVGVPATLALIFLRLGDLETLEVGTFAAAALTSALLASPQWRRSRMHAWTSRWLGKRRDARGRRRERSEWVAAVAFCIAMGALGGFLVAISSLTGGPVHRLTLGFGGPVLAFYGLLVGIALFQALIDWRGFAR